MPTTIFNKVDYTLSSLMDEIASGQLALPDIQRPFVWKNVQVRDLLDSIYRGYPIGYFLFWETGARPGTRQIGTDQKQLVPTKVIVDGQQRLTALYAVVKRIPIVRANFATEKIEIAFNPLEGRFEVPDAAIRRDKRFIPDISAIWSSDTNLIKFAGQYIEDLRGQLGDLTPEQISHAQTSLGELHSLLSFPCTVLVLSSQAKGDEVSEVFVRINSEGKKLNQSDFILTLMSVYWDEGRKQLEEFSRQSRVPSLGKPSPFNHLFQPKPDHLLRVAIAVGLRRARLSAVYLILRGRDATKDADVPAVREEQFAKLMAGQAAALNLQYWHDFLHCLTLAGYRTARIISSENSLVFAYALYLIGRTELRVEERVLRQAIAQWIFMSNLTGRFTSSPESQMEFDLARLRGVKDADEFIAMVKGICSSALTNDFWTITLPGDLATSAGRSPSMFAFFAALNVLDARVLYSPHSMRDLTDPSVRGNRASLERHHLFPVAFLKKSGFSDQRDYNQIANYAVVEWGDNAKIAEAPPSVYVPEIEKGFDSKVLSMMYKHHGLPFGWERMSFPDFLRERRNLMAQTIRDAYDALAGERRDSGLEVGVLDLIESGESTAVEFKSTLRTNLHTLEKDPRIEMAVLKTIAGFLNAAGGTLIIGVADDGTAIGTAADDFQNEDKMTLHLINLLKDRIGGDQAINVHCKFDDYEGARVLVVSCDRSRAPVWVRDGSNERFFVRYGPTTQELTGGTAQSYIQQRFR